MTTASGSTSHPETLTSIHAIPPMSENKLGTSTLSNTIHTKDTPTLSNSVHTKGTLTLSNSVLTKGTPILSNAMQTTRSSTHRVTVSHNRSTTINNTSSVLSSNTIHDSIANNTTSLGFPSKKETTASLGHTVSKQPINSTFIRTTYQHVRNSTLTRNISSDVMTTVSTRVDKLSTSTVQLSEWTNTSTSNSTSFITDSSSPTCYSKTTLIIISSVSGGIILLLTVMSLLCCLRLKTKWRKKLTTERERTDIWSMRTYNNTIINDNFMDYQLAPATIPPRSSAKHWRKSSAYSERSFNIVDPYSRRSSKTNPDEDLYFRSGSVGKRGSRDYQFSFDDSTLRRNTYSAPGGLDEPEVTSSALQHSDKHFNNSRDRSLTFSVGKKQKIDRHVLLTHEEIIEDEKIHQYAVVTPSHSMYVTEL